MTDKTDGAGPMLLAVLGHCADVAFPLEGSDYAAASRKAVQVIVNKIKQDERAVLKHRQRPMLKSAVN